MSMEGDERSPRKQAAMNAEFYARIHWAQYLTQQEIGLRWFTERSLGVVRLLDP